MDSILERAGKSLGVCTALLLVVSVAFDYGFLRAMGLSFASVPTSLTDHIRTAIIWAPIMGVPLFFGFVFGFGSSKRTPPSPQTTSLVALWWIGLFIIILIQSSGLEVVLLMLIALLFSGAYFFKGVFAAANQSVGLAIIGATSVVFLAAYLGHVQGGLMFTGDSRFTVEAKLDSTQVQLTDVSMRRFSTFVIAVERNQIAHVLHESTILRVQARVTPPRRYFCEWLSIGCPPAPTNSAALPASGSAGALSGVAAPASAASAPAVRASGP